MAETKAIAERAPATTTSNVDILGLSSLMKVTAEAKVKRAPAIDNHPNQKSLLAVDQYSPDHTVTWALVLSSVPNPNPYVLPETSKAP